MGGILRCSESRFVSLAAKCFLYLHLTEPNQHNRTLPVLWAETLTRVKVSDTFLVTLHGSQRIGIFAASDLNVTLQRLLCLRLPLSAFLESIANSAGGMACLKCEPASFRCIWAGKSNANLAPGIAHVNGQRIVADMTNQHQHRRLLPTE